MKIKHFLYNAFLIEHQGLKIAIDPGRNLWWFKLDSLIPESEWEDVTHVFVTHADPDHFAYALAMAEKTGATAICGKALADDFLNNQIRDIHQLEVERTLSLASLEVEGLNAKHGPLPVKLFAGLIQMNNEIAQGNCAGKSIFLGPLKVFKSMENKEVFSRGTVSLLFGLIKLVKENVDFARGSIGFKITIGDKTLVNLGDSTLLNDWAGLRPDVLMIPIGGRRVRNTMDEDEALEAIRQIDPKTVIPCHYNCAFLWRKNINPADDHLFKQEVEKRGKVCHIMHYGDEIII